MRRILMIAVVLFCALESYAQCSIPSYPAAGTGHTPATTVLSTSNNTLLPGDVRDYTGTPSATLTNINFKGGQLNVYSNLTLTNSSGQSSGGAGSSYIIVEPGVTLTLPSSFHMNGDLTIVNYGTINFTGGATVNGTVTLINLSTINITGALNSGSGSAVINVLSTSVFNADGGSGSVSFNGALINNGKMNFTYNNATFNSSGSLCMGNGAQTSFSGNLTLNVEFSVSPSNAVAQLSAGKLGTVNGTHKVTSSPGLYMCFGNSASLNPSVAGAGHMANPCPAGTNLLPVIFQSYRLHIENTSDCVLEWQTASETNVKDFVVEYSYDGKNFNPLTTVPAHNAASLYTYHTPLQARTWYRIKSEDVAGGSEYSVVLLADYQVKGSQPETGTLKVQPTVVTNQVLQVVKTNVLPERGTIQVFDISGRVVLSQAISFEAGTNNTAIYLHGLGAGIYILSYNGPQGMQPPVKFCIAR